MTKNISSDKNLSKVSDLNNSINKIVVSRGNPFAKLMIIGEAPGAKEEESNKKEVKDQSVRKQCQFSSCDLSVLIKIKKHKMKDFNN